MSTSSFIKPANVIRITLAALLMLNLQAVSAQEKGLSRATLLSKPVELPSNSIDAKVIRVTIPPTFKTPRHTHEGPGPRYVVKGTLTVVEGGNANTYSAGEVFWESGQLMTVENKGDTAAELLIFELAPAK